MGSFSGPIVLKTSRSHGNVEDSFAPAMVFAYAMPRREDEPPCYDTVNTGHICTALLYLASAQSYVASSVWSTSYNDFRSDYLQYCLLSLS